MACHSDMMELGSLLRTYRNKPLIARGKQPGFDWKDGLVGESTPDRVIVPSVEPVGLRTLIMELGGCEDEDLSGDVLLSRKPGATVLRPQPIRRGFTFPIPLEKKRSL